MKRSIRMAMATVCVLGATVAHAEIITALAIHDTYLFDRDDVVTQATLGLQDRWYTTQAFFGQFHYGVPGRPNYGGEIIGAAIFEPEKFQNYSPSDVRNATLRVELKMQRSAPLAVDMGWDVVAMQDGPWDDTHATWNAREQACELIFGIVWNCTEEEATDWFPDNGVDDVVTAVVGNEIYASLDGDMSDYFDALGIDHEDEEANLDPKINTVGIIKEWDVTRLVKAWLDGTENLAYGLAIRNELDARGLDGTELDEEKQVERRYSQTHFWSKDATQDPTTGNERSPMDGLVVLNDDPWPPIVPQIVIELGEAAGRLAGDANQDGVVSADDYANVQSNFGNTNGPGLAGDANDDGVVSADDYASVQSNFGNTAGLQAAVSAAAAAQAPTAHFSFNETAAGSWAVSVEVTGDTAGLSAYSIWTRGVDPSQVSYEEGTLGTIGDGFAPRGFQVSTFVSGDVGGDFNAGNFQGNSNAAIAGIGTDAVDDAGVIPGTTPHVQLGVPALLGTLTTPDGLGAANFEATSVGLLNVAGDGFLSDPPTPTSEVNLIPEPASLSVVALGAMLLLRHRSRREAKGDWK